MLFGRLLSLLFCTVVLLIAVGAPLNAQELEPTPTLLPEEIPAAIAPITEGDYDILNFFTTGQRYHTPDECWTY